MQMTPERRIFIALFLSFVFCAAWIQWMQHKQQEWRKANPQKNLQDPKLKQTPQEVPPKKEPAPQETPVLEQKPNLPDASVEALSKDEKETLISVETEKYSMVWSNKGAGLCSLKLKEYYHNYADRKAKNYKSNPENWLELLPRFSTHLSSLVLFHEETLAADGKTTKIKLENALWTVVDHLKENPSQLIFTLGPVQGIQYTKTFTFYPDKNYFQGEITLENFGTTEQTKSFQFGAGAGIDVEGTSVSEAARSIYGYAMYPNPKNQPLYEDYDYGDLLKGNLVLEKKIAWVSLVNRYFGYVLHIQKPDSITSMKSKPFAAEESWIQSMVAMQKKHGETPQKEEFKNMKQVMLCLESSPIVLKPQERATIPFQFYLGTKEYLSTVDKTYPVVDDYGFFGPISHLLLLVLGFFYKIFQNYGVAIICLTILIKLCLFPLTRKQQISMQNYQKKMKKFQPQLKRLQEKYKNDKQKLNQEIMKLYKEHNVNPLPLGGCLPIFLQLPIFIGLYQALYYSNTLRQAPFLWISDLSQPDKLFQFGTYVTYVGDYFNILPVVMTVVWVIQQKMAPKPDDPQMQQQQKMFMFMSIIFGFMFYHVASGLVLYWMVMNFISILEQEYIKRYDLAKLPE